MEDVEIRIAHLERTIEELGDVIARQDGDIERLKAQIVLLMEREKAREAEGSGGVILGDERPPHY